MAIALTVAEMCEILEREGLPEYRAKLEALGSEVARAVADRYSVTMKDAPMLDMGDAQATFGPSRSGQPMPEVFGRYDDSDEWEAEDI